MNRQDVSHEAIELYLFGLNDEQLYRQQREAIEKNLQRKFDEGTYDSSKAVKLWRYFADNTAKKYNAEFCSAGKWHHLFSTKDRQEMAMLCEKEHLELMRERVEA